MTFPCSAELSTSLQKQAEDGTHKKWAELHKAPTISDDDSGLYSRYAGVHLHYLMAK